MTGQRRRPMMITSSIEHVLSDVPPKSFMTGIGAGGGAFFKAATGHPELDPPLDILAGFLYSFHRF